MNCTDTLPAEPRIAVVGSGRVATYMATVLHQSGCCITEVWSRQREHAAQLAAKVGSSVADKLETLHEADCCLIAVTDDALPEVAARIRMPHTLVIHTSGCTPAVALAACAEHYGVIWPPLSIPESTVDITALHLCIEGSDGESTNKLRQLAEKMQAQYTILTSEQRRWAHLATVVAGNFGNALLAETERLATEHNVPFELLVPIIEQTARRAAAGNLWSRQTGPAARGDRQTLDTQRQMLENDDTLRELYDLFSRIITDRTHRSQS